MKVFMIVLLAVAAVSGSKLQRQVGERAGECPEPSGLAGICIFIPGVNCIDDSECGDGEKCCSEGCGRICKAIVSAARR